MKPTCPTFCKLKRAKDQHQEVVNRIEDSFRQMDPEQRHKLIAFTAFIAYRDKGLLKRDTWRDMVTRRDVSRFIRGFFLKLDYLIRR